ncbi:hypothetical protein CCR85_02340 [Rhodothalassium salexigens]|uniref:helix-turn-helix domain-containing protein n=1 Tax=Rhodothalassium salexigens TaxID=1086 RepID=UPI001912098E|nr:helix-turn-helix domain-containing protein [Rhodothalassium salexigens]MBK5910328.1 hypothetical protein [Rhodothalassium salexigens]
MIKGTLSDDLAVILHRQPAFAERLRGNRARWRLVDCLIGVRRQAGLTVAETARRSGLTAAQVAQLETVTGAWPSQTLVNAYLGAFGLLPFDAFAEPVSSDLEVSDDAAGAEAVAADEDAALAALIDPDLVEEADAVGLGDAAVAREDAAGDDNADDQDINDPDDDPDDDLDLSF